MYLRPKIESMTDKELANFLEISSDIACQVAAERIRELHEEIEELKEFKRIYNSLKR